MKKVVVFQVVAFLLVVSVMHSCGKPCVEALYHFSIVETFAPETDSIQVGDTLSLISFHSTTFIDSTAGNKQVDFSNSSLGANIRVLQFSDSSQSVIGAVPNFTILILKGRAIGNDYIPTENKGVEYEELDSEYKLEVKFIPLKKGIYSISMGNSIGVIKQKKGCIKANFEITNSNANSHLYYYQNWRPGYTISDYERSHMYCFKVY